MIVLQGSWDWKWFAYEKHITLKRNIFTYPEKNSQEKCLTQTTPYLSSGQSDFFFFLNTGQNEFLFKHQAFSLLKTKWRFKNASCKNCNINLKVPPESDSDVLRWKFLRPYVIGRMTDDTSLYREKSVRVYPNNASSNRRKIRTCTWKIKMQIKMETLHFVANSF